MLKIVVSSMIAALSLSASAAEQTISDSEIAESVFLSTLNAKNFIDFVESSEIESKHKEQITQYLQLHHLEKKAVDTKWNTGSSIVDFNDGSSTLSVDFADLAKDKTVKVNGVRVDASQLSHFSDVVAKFEAAADKKTALLEFIFPEARATADSSKSIAGSIAYWSGLDQLAACLEGVTPLTGESITRSKCAFRKNSSMILANVGKYSQLTELTCSSHGFKSAAVRFGYGTVKLTSTRDRTGKLSDLSLFNEKSLYCKYNFKGGALAAVENNTVTPAYCDGRVVGDQFGVSHPLASGTKLSFVSAFPVSIQRLDKCCRDSVCRTEINLAIKQGTCSKSGSNSTRANR